LDSIDEFIFANFSILEPFKGFSEFFCNWLQDKFGKKEITSVFPFDVKLALFAGLLEASSLFMTKKSTTCESTNY